MREVQGVTSAHPIRQPVGIEAGGYVHAELLGE